MRTRTALVLSGGGLAGAVYHVGALRALNDVLLDRSVNDFDIFVGTSAGAVVASALANGVRPRDLYRAIEGQAGPASLRRDDVFRLNYPEFARKFLGLPLVTGWAIWHYLRHLGDMGLYDFVSLFGDALPSGVFQSGAIAQYLGGLFAEPGRTDDFRRLRNDLVIIATDLDTGARVCFGNQRAPGVQPEHGRRLVSDVSISSAAAASAAVPVLYTPMRIRGRDYVDGGIRGTASVDIAVEHGAELVICINPLVPFDNQARDIPKLGPNAQRVSDKGFGVITNQVSRVMLHAGLQYHIKHLRRAHPDVDIIVIEPRRDDARLFFNNIMRYSSRLHVLHHGYESVLVELEEREPAEKEMLARHGIRLRRSLMREQLRRIRRAAYDPDVVSEVVGSRRRRPLEVGARAARWDALSATLELLDRELSLREARKTA